MTKSGKQKQMSLKTSSAAATKPRSSFWANFWPKPKPSADLVPLASSPSGKSQAPKVDPVRLQETIVTPRAAAPSGAVGSSALAPSGRGELTSPSKLAAQVDRDTQRKRSRDQQKNRDLVMVLLVGLISLLTAYGMHRHLTSGRGVSEAQKLAEQAASESFIKDRVEYHRAEVGQRLNRERVSVEVQNLKSAQNFDPKSQRVTVPDMMSGLPLAPENTNRDSTRDRLQAMNPNLADARVMYILKEQQAANDFEDNARKKYIEEFIANAERAGYRVRVDENGTVTVLGRSMPASGGQMPPWQRRQPTSAGEPGMGQ